MFSFKQTDALQILNNHISVQVAAEYSGYSSQYLRRLLRNRKSIGIKIGQLWVLDISVLDAYMKQVQDVSDQKFGPKISK